MMGAIISDCGQYRYVLGRERGDFDPKFPPAVFIMLNPSTADAELDDPTIRRCRGFARDWRCDGLVVVNLYAYRATKPADLFRADDPIGPDNDDHLRNIAGWHRRAVAAWGANARQDRVDQVVKLFQESGATLFCLGTTKSGAPRHPLYVRADQPLIPWEVTHAPSID